MRRWKPPEVEVQEKKDLMSAWQLEVEETILKERTMEEALERIVKWIRYKFTYSGLTYSGERWNIPLWVWGTAEAKEEQRKWQNLLREGDKWKEAYEEYVMKREKQEKRARGRRMDSGVRSEKERMYREWLGHVYGGKRGVAERLKEIGEGKDRKRYIWEWIYRRQREGDGELV